MTEEPITPLEKKLLEEVIRPAISMQPTPSNILFAGYTVSESLNFFELIRNIKDFYQNNGGRLWRTVIESTTL